MFVDIRDLPATEKTDALCVLFRTEIGAASLPNEMGSAPRSDQLYLWIYWISQRSKALYFGLLSDRAGGRPRQLHPAAPALAYWVWFAGVDSARKPRIVVRPM